MRTITEPFFKGREREPAVFADSDNMRVLCHQPNCQAELLLDEEDIGCVQAHEDIEIGFICVHCSHFTRLSLLGDPYLMSVKSMVAHIQSHETWFNQGRVMPFSEAALVRALNEWISSPAYERGDPMPRKWETAIKEAKALGVDTEAMEYFREHSPSATHREIFRVAAALERANA